VIILAKIPKNYRLDEEIVDKIHALKKLIQHGQLVPKKLTDTDVVEYAIAELYRSFEQQGYDLKI